MKDRGKRIENKERIIKKRKKFLKGMEQMSEKDLCERLNGQENRLASKHPYDCGNAKCGVCHPHKHCPSKNKSLVDRIEDDIVADMCDDFGEE